MEINQKERICEISPVTGIVFFGLFVFFESATRGDFLEIYVIVAEIHRERGDVARTYMVTWLPLLGRCAAPHGAGGRGDASGAARTYRGGVHIPPDSRVRALASETKLSEAAVSPLTQWIMRGPRS